MRVLLGQDPVRLEDQRSVIGSSFRELCQPSISWTSNRIAAAVLVIAYCATCRSALRTATSILDVFSRRREENEVVNAINEILRVEAAPSRSLEDRLNWPST